MARDVKKMGSQATRPVMTSYLDEALVLIVADVRAGRLVPASEASSRPEVFVAQTAVQGVERVTPESRKEGNFFSV